MYLKSPYGEIIVGCHENDCGLIANQLADFKSVELRHLDVQEYQVRLQFRHRLHCLKAVRALRGDFYIVMRGKVFAQHLPRQFLIVHDDCANLMFLFAAHAGRASFSAGSVILTRKMPPSGLTSKLARLPYRAAIRWRTFASPTPPLRRGG